MARMRAIGLSLLSSLLGKMKITTRIIFGIWAICRHPVGDGGLSDDYHLQHAVHKPNTERIQFSEYPHLSASNVGSLLVEEYARKSFAVADAGYLRQLKEFQKDYETKLIQLRDHAISP